MTVLPLTEARNKISAKTPVGSVLRSKAWARMPIALREASQFSAGVASMRVMQSIQDRLQAELSGQLERLADGSLATFDRSSFIDRLRDIARAEGLTPADEAERGTITDITSIPRLGLIYDMQTSMAKGYAGWKLDQEPGALDLWPAQELVRIEDRKMPRDWVQRWRAAGGRFYDGGRMIALKTDPIWARLNRFGTPWPPFDYGSGMGLEDVDRDEAVRLGLLREDEDIEPVDKDFTDQMQASAKGLGQRALDVLRKFFGDQVVQDGDTLKWRTA